VAREARTPVWLIEAPDTYRVGPESFERGDEGRLIPPDDRK
jgi:hypothetical protein